MSTTRITAGLLAVGAVLVGGYFGARSAPPPSEYRTQPGPVSSAPAFLTVHVAGMVVEPGVVSVPEGSLVVDAIAAAGGALTEAHLASINLSRPVIDGELIEVPGAGGSPGLPANAAGGLVPINSAGAQDLMSLPGVGAVLAERIVAYREANGPFSSVEDLLDVSGIGESKLASIRDLIRVP